MFISLSIDMPVPSSFFFFDWALICKSAQVPGRGRYAGIDSIWNEFLSTWKTWPFHNCSNLFTWLHSGIFQALHVEAKRLRHVEWNLFFFPQRRVAQGEQGGIVLMAQQQWGMSGGQRCHQPHPNGFFCLQVFNCLPATIGSKPHSKAGSSASGHFCELPGILSIDCLSL